MKYQFTACPSRQSASLEINSIGDSIDFRCLASSPCLGNNYIFYHYNLCTGEFETVHYGSYKFYTNISSLSDAGEYYCIKECARNLTSADELKCYWNITGEQQAINTQTILMS